MTKIQELITIALDNRSIRLILLISFLISVSYIMQYFIRIYLAKKKKQKGYVIQIIPPKYQPEDFVNEASTRFTLQRFIDNLTATVKNERISFEIFADNTGIKFLIWCPTLKVKELVKLNLYSTYKERIKIKELDFDPVDKFQPYDSEINEYKTAKHDVYMLMDVKDFEGMDPVNDLAGSMIGLEQDDKILFQVVLKPTKLDKLAFSKAKENFRLRKGEISWLSIFFGRFESYFLFLIPLLPLAILRILSELMKAFSTRPQMVDPMQMLHDSDPRKVMVQQDELADFNKRMNEKFKTPFTSYIRVIATGKSKTDRLDAVEQALETMKSETQNRLVRRSSKKFDDLNSRFIYPEDNSFPFYRELFTNQCCLSSREISMLTHLPSEIFDPTIDSYVFPEIAAKKQFRDSQSESDLMLGLNHSREKKFSVYLNEENRKRHLVVTGQTGTGKSTILKNFVLQDIDNRILKGTKRGLILMDPHEDFFMDILRKLPKSHASNNSLILWDTSSEEYYLGFNPLYAIGLTEREIDLIVDSNYKLIEKLIEKINPQGGMGTTAKPILINGMKTLMVMQNEWIKKYPEKAHIMQKYAPTLADVRSLFLGSEIDEVVREIIDLERYEGLRAFWDDILPNYRKSRSWNEIRQGFDNKISQILSGVLLYTFGQSQSSINVEQCIRRSKHLLVNLSAKNLGEEGMSLLGSFLMSKVWFEARRIEQGSRRPFVVYADEFQNFATSDFSQALSEARKFKLELILAHQFFKQLPEKVKDAVTGNVKSKIYYRAGLDDSEEIAKELQGKIIDKEVMEIPEFHSIVKVGEDVFTINVPKERDDNFSDEYVENLIQEQYEKYGRTKNSIEQEIIDRKKWIVEGCSPNVE